MFPLELKVEFKTDYVCSRTRPDIVVDTVEHFRIDTFVTTCAAYILNGSEQIESHVLRKTECIAECDVVQFEEGCVPHIVV